MKYILLIFTIFTTYQFSYGQQEESSTLTIKEGLSDAEFLKTKEEYQKMSNSDLYKAQTEASYTMAIRLGRIQNIFL